MTRLSGYRVIGSVDLVCSLGETHKTNVYAEHFFTPTDEDITKDWYGYGKSTTFPADIYVDSKGNRYARVGPMDFYGGSTFNPIDGTTGGTWGLRKPNGIRFDEVNND